MGNRTDVSHPKAALMKYSWKLRFTWQASADFVHHQQDLIYAHVWIALLPLLWWKGLQLSPSIMGQIPIGLACWRGIMPQGQLRHSVSLSGWCTGQWRRVTHRWPAHPWTSHFLPFVCDIAVKSGLQDCAARANQEIREVELTAFTAFILQSQTRVMHVYVTVCEGSIINITI